MKKISVLLLILFAVVMNSMALSIITEDEIILNAMKLEMKRSIESLSIPSLQKPAYISYTIADSKTMCIQARLGAVIQSDDNPLRTQDVRVLVGNYAMSNENYLDFNTVWGRSSYITSPRETSMNTVRISLWMDTDSKYKRAAESYESKKSALQQQKLNEELPPDFVAVKPSSLFIPRVQHGVNKKEWEKNITELSSLFRTYSGLQSSEVALYVYATQVYFVDSEGAVVTYPLQVVALRAWATAQADDGEPLYDHVAYYTASIHELPSMKTLRSDIVSMASHLTALAKAPVFNESYTGPVLFEGQAAAEVVAQKFFADTHNMSAVRKPILASKDVASYLDTPLENTLESRIGKKVIDRGLKLTVLPKLEKFATTRLIGATHIDMEGVETSDSIVLIDNGELKTLLNGRTPTQKITASNGHMRPSLEYNFLKSDIGPSVATFESTKKMSMTELKKKMIDFAKEEGLDYVYIVRKLENRSVALSSNADNDKKTLSRPLALYRVNVATGAEELVRSADFDGFTLRAFRRVMGVADKQIAYNTLLQKKSRSYWGNTTLNGMPASFIVPEGILFEEVDLQQEKRSITPKLPIVPNPLAIK